MYIRIYNQAKGIMQNKENIWHLLYEKYVYIDCRDRTQNSPKIIEREYDWTCEVRP